MTSDAFSGYNIKSFIPEKIKIGSFMLKERKLIDFHLRLSVYRRVILEVPDYYTETNAKGEFNFSIIPALPKCHAPLLNG